MKGKKPTSSRVKALKGSEKRYLKANEMQGEPIKKLWAPPKKLGKYGVQLWRKVGRMLVARDVLTDLDKWAFQCLCEAWDSYQIASEDISNIGMIVTGPNLIPKKNPLLTVQAQSRQKFLSLCERFGLDPLSRTRLDLPQKAEDNPYTRWKEKKKALRNAKKA